MYLLIPNEITVEYIEMNASEVFTNSRFEIQDLRNSDVVEEENDLFEEIDIEFAEKSNEDVIEEI